MSDLEEATMKSSIGWNALERSSVLDGLSVLEVGGIGPVQFAGMFLAQLGAHVVRIERPDTVATYGFDPREDLLNAGKRSVVLDLKDARGLRVTLDAIMRSDVVIEGFRPGVIERLGIDPQRCLDLNPRLIFGRMTGWGQDGPLATHAGHDVNYIGLTGLLPMIGEAGRPPQLPLSIVGDFAGGGCYLVIGVLAALEQMRRTGRGEIIDAAMLDGVCHLMTAFHALSNAGEWAPRRQANVLDGGAPFYGLYETSDGRFMAVGAIETVFYARVLAVLGLSGLLSHQFDRDNWPRARARIAAVFATRPQADWASDFASVDACVSPVLAQGEAAGHPQHQSRGTLVEQDGRVWARPAPRFNRAATRSMPPPPVPGQHTREVLLEWGLDPDAIENG